MDGVISQNCKSLAQMFCLGCRSLTKKSATSLHTQLYNLWVLQISGDLYRYNGIHSAQDKTCKCMVQLFCNVRKKKSCVCPFYALYNTVLCILLKDLLFRCCDDDDDDDDGRL